MLPLNDVRQIEYFNGRDLHPGRLYQRWTLKNELKLLRLRRRPVERSAAVAHSTELEAAPVPR